MFKTFMAPNNGRKSMSLQSGMTMIEVLISLAMVGMLLVLFAASFNVILLTKKIRNENIAYHAANKKMEELRNFSYDSLPASGSFTDASLNDIPNASADFVIQDYPSYSNMKEFIVTVAWDDGRARSVVLRSVSGPGGIQP